jgi:glucose-1-phosphatase
VIVWDLGGVVAEFRPDRRLRALSEQSGLATADIHARIWDSGLDAAAERGELSERETWDSVLTALEQRMTRPAVRRAWATAFVPNPEVLALADAVGEPSALLTNNGPILGACLEAGDVDLGGRFAPRLLSWQLGRAKPDREAFRRAAQLTGHDPAELLFVDDDANNVAAARQAGWQAVRFDGVPSLAKALSSRHA